MRQFDSVDEVVDLYSRWGNDNYDEDITQLSHAVQCASLAKASGASDELVVAALLHDIGHLIDLDTSGAHEGSLDTDLKHEAVGAQALAKLFSAAVTAPVALHVEAKRWRCAAEPAYRDALSPASTASLLLQGGPMNPDERARFEAHPQFSAATRLRSWDDTGKSDDTVDPPFERFVPLLHRVARLRPSGEPAESR